MSPALQAVFHAPSIRSQTYIIQLQNTTVQTRNQGRDFIITNADTNSFRQYVRYPGLPQSPLHAVRQYNSHSSPETALGGRREAPLKGNLNSNLEIQTKNQISKVYLPASLPGVNLAFTRTYWWGPPVSSSALARIPWMLLPRSLGRERDHQVARTHTTLQSLLGQRPLPFLSLPPPFHLRPPPSA